MNPTSIRVIVILLVGLMAAATASTLVRLALEEGMPPIVIAAGRLLVATVILGPIALTRHRHEFRKLNARDWQLLLLCGIVLGAHFVAWISSLEYTSVLASVTLVSTAPLFVLIFGLIFLRERVSRIVVIGITVTIMGSLVVGLGADAGHATIRAAPLLGNSLSVLGAVAFALCFVIGRRLRSKLHVVPYVTVVYGVGALFLTVITVARGGTFWGYSPAAYLWLVGVGLLPQLIGHSAFNYALGYFPAAYVGLMTRFEPIGSTLLAAFVLGEWPKPIAIVGGLVILVGVALPSWSVLVGAGRARDAAG